ncbi:uncharacterized protein TNCV_227991 [Trichonephila clavipes]|nr:uncharacterized protein TNCV_227991 [Trichonephila clavipes]
MTEMKLKMLVNTKVCLQHFGFSFAVVSSFLGWPTVKLKQHYCKPLASPREGNVPDGGKERRRNIRTQQNPLGPQERQTRISKARSLQRIVWCESEHESPKIYELSIVTYGTVSAPYLAQRTLTQLSMDEEANFPIAASVLRNNLYMDDVLCGAATLEEAIVLRQQLKGILKSAGMELHKLCANHEKLSPDPEQNYNFATLTETKTLGVSWKPNLDCLLIKVKVCLDSSYAKRDVLSTIAKIFDPVGLMAPVISKEKIFLQRLWRSKLEWNDLLPAEEYREWQHNS